jgi:hypothetical protein
MLPMSMVTSMSPPVMVMMLNTISDHSVVLARFPKVLFSNNQQQQMIISEAHQSASNQIDLPPNYEARLVT